MFLFKNAPQRAATIYRKHEKYLTLLFTCVVFNIQFTELEQHLQNSDCNLYTPLVLLWLTLVWNVNDIRLHLGFQAMIVLNNMVSYKHVIVTSLTYLCLRVPPEIIVWIDDTFDNN